MPLHLFVATSMRTYQELYLGPQFSEVAGEHGPSVA